MSRNVSPSSDDIDLNFIEAMAQSADSDMARERAAGTSQAPRRKRSPKAEPAPATEPVRPVVDSAIRGMLEGFIDEGVTQTVIHMKYTEPGQDWRVNVRGLAAGLILRMIPEGAEGPVTEGILLAAYIGMWVASNELTKPRNVTPKPTKEPAPAVTNG